MRYGGEGTSRGLGSSDSAWSMQWAKGWTWGFSEDYNSLENKSEPKDWKISELEHNDD